MPILCSCPEAGLLCGRWFSKFKGDLALKNPAVLVITETFLNRRISLNTMTLQVDSANVYTSQGVSVSVTGIAQVLGNPPSQNLSTVDWFENCFACRLRCRVRMRSCWWLPASSFWAWRKRTSAEWLSRLWRDTSVPSWAAWQSK